MLMTQNRFLIARFLHQLSTLYLIRGGVHAEETGKENDFTGIAPMGLFGGLGG
jgi:hypothetical protein